MDLRKRLTVILVLLLISFLTLGAPILAVGAENDVLDEVRALLRDEYVEPVSEEVLNAPTIAETLKRLGDRHTEYLTKSDYDSFVNSIEMSFSGVGIELQMVPRGIEVTRVIEGYGADKAGIQRGDIIIEADGFSLAGKTNEYSVSKLRGPEGSKVKVKVLRGAETLTFAVERMVIELPLVESEVLEGHIGYIAVYSFGEDTVAQFDRQAQALIDKGVDSWIIDLRDNGGGYTQAAFELLGFFIEDKTAVILKDRSPVSIAYRAQKQNYTLEGPIILLTNKYTASSSEITTAAVKDYNKATIVGDTTYGSGRVKALIPLSNGDTLKMTINKFYSPYGLPIDEVGIQPHLNLAGVDELKAAMLMLKDQNNDGAKGITGDKTGYIQLNAGSNDFSLSLEELKKPGNWSLGKKILDSAYVTTTLKLGGENGWEPFPEAWLQERYKLYYQGYDVVSKLTNIPLNKTFTVTFTKEMDWKSVNNDSIELLNPADGSRLKCSFTYVDNYVMKVTPQEILKAGTDYWLVIHPTVKGADGRGTTPGLALARTVK